MVVATYFLRLYGIIKYAGFLSERVICCEATETEGLIYSIYIYLLFYIKIIAFVCQNN